MRDLDTDWLLIPCVAACLHAVGIIGIIHLAAFGSVPYQVVWQRTQRRGLLTGCQSQAMPKAETRIQRKIWQRYPGRCAETMILGPSNRSGLLAE